MGKLFRNPPFRAEHLGSLLRPHDLLAIRAKVDKKEATEEEMLELEHKAIKEIVDVQLELGFHAITDGEYGRHSKLCFK
jgi:methionine synthase II (cobalamin-independent)